MNPAFSRRAAMKGTVAAAAVVAIPGTAVASDFKELNWMVSVPATTPVPFRTRVISGVPAFVEYGKPVVFGPVIVQAIGGPKVTAMARAANCTSFAGVITTTVAVTDARGLSGRFPITVTFPRTSIPPTNIDYVLTGTATLAEGTPLPAPRNPGPMTIAAESPAKGAITIYKATGATTEYVSSMTLVHGQDPVLATVEVR